MSVIYGIQDINRSILRSIDYFIYFFDLCTGVFVYYVFRNVLSIINFVKGFIVSYFD